MRQADAAVRHPAARHAADAIVHTYDCTCGEIVAVSAVGKQD